MRFARSPWGDLTLEERMPAFLEALLFEQEAEVQECHTVIHPD